MRAERPHGAAEGNQEAGEGVGGRRDRTGRGGGKGKGGSAAERSGGVRAGQSGTGSEGPQVRTEGAEEESRGDAWWRLEGHRECKRRG